MCVGIDKPLYLDKANKQAKGTANSSNKRITLQHICRFLIYCHGVCVCVCVCVCADACAARVGAKSSRSATPRRRGGVRVCVCVCVCVCVRVRVRGRVRGCVCCTRGRGKLTVSHAAAALHAWACVSPNAAKQSQTIIIQPSLYVSVVRTCSQLALHLCLARSARTCVMLQRRPASISS